MLCSDNRILCGVTTDALLKKKAYAEYLEPFDARELAVRRFCHKVNPNLGERLITFELEDPVGPTGTDPDLEALILTREVEKGGKMVNDARSAKGLGPLDLVFVDMILAEVKEEERASQFSNKTSSTYIREYLASKH
jgi:pantetheine-phosphate adenylyltransferase